MNFSSTFFAVGAFLGFATAKLQIAIVYDLSQGASQGEKMKTAFSEGLLAAVNQLAEKDVEFALATSVDKPVPSLGVGLFGDYPKYGYLEDYCFRREVDFTADYSLVHAALMSASPMNGLDVYQGQLEAVVNALLNEDMKWDDDESTTKLVITVTDNWTHSAADESLPEATLAFSQPVRCTTEGETAGGFGATKPNVEIDYSWFLNEDEYMKYAKLHQIRACVEDLSAEDQKAYEKFREDYKVRVWPKTLPFDTEVLKANSEEHCKYHQYPSFQDVTAAFLEKGAKWIVFHGDSEGGFGSTWMYTTTTSEWGFLPTPMVVANIPDKSVITAEESAEELAKAFAQLSIA